MKSSKTNILFVGDSHSAAIIDDFSTVYSHRENIEYHFKRDRIKTEHEVRTYSSGIFYGKKENISMVSIHGSGYNFNPSFIQQYEWFNDEDSIAIFWLGYNDVMDMIKFPNHHVTLDKYIKRIIAIFDKAKIKLFYPIYNIKIHNDPELREHHKSYCELLKRTAELYGLDEPIDINGTFIDILTDQNNYVSDGVHLWQEFYWMIWNGMRSKLGLMPNEIKHIELNKIDEGIWYWTGLSVDDLLDNLKGYAWKDYNNDEQTLIGSVCIADKGSLEYAEIQRLFIDYLAQYEPAKLNNIYNDNLDNHRFNVRRYDVGSYMTAHGDGYSYVTENGEEVKPIYTMIIYLNDEYDGGEIEFVDKKVSIKPKAGSMVIFPSSDKHQVN